MSLGLTKEYLQEQPIEQQVQLVNNWLKDMSLSAIGKMLKTDESTIRKRFNYNGYERKGKKFIKVNNNTKELQVQHKHKGNTQGILSKEIENKSLEERVSALEKAMKELKGEKTPEKHKTNTTKNTYNLNIYRSTERPISRNHRFYPEVLEKLKEVKELYPEYTIQDIINSLLMEAISNYIK